MLDNIKFICPRKKETKTTIAYENESSRIRELSDNEAKNYVIGFVGKKLGLKGKMPTSETWIGLKGQGKLLEPSDELINICDKCDIMFDKFHGAGFRDCSDPQKALVKFILDEYPTFPIRIVQLFCRTKFYARLKHLNNDLKMESYKKSTRMYKQTGQFVN